jgi:hypothetical protein
MAIRNERELFSKEKKRKQYVDNLQGFIFMAQVNNKELTIIEDNIINKCKAKDFWGVLKIDVMDIELENNNFKKCDYINKMLILEYNNRIIKIKLTK